MPKHKPSTDFVLLDGDVWDCYWFSKFGKDSGQRNPKEEMGCVVGFFDSLRHWFGKHTKIIYKAGNHDDRWDKWIWEKAADVIGPVCPWNRWFSVPEAASQTREVPSSLPVRTERPVEGTGGDAQP